MDFWNSTSGNHETAVSRGAGGLVNRAVNVHIEQRQTSKKKLLLRSPSLSVNEPFALLKSIAKMAIN